MILKRRRELSMPTEIESPIVRLRSEMDRLFESFFRQPWGFLGREGLETAAWGPDVDVVDGDKEITIRAEIPGVDPKDIDVSVTGNTLVLSGEKRLEREEKKENYFHSEIAYGTFRRAIPLPVDVDADKINADFDKGVLTVRVPKTKIAAPKRVNIVKK